MMKLILATAVLLVVVSSCKKEIKTLPEETQTGAGTFGAKVDGENWGPLKFGVVPSAPLLEARFGIDSSVFIVARNFSRSPVETEMEIYIHHITGPGVYPFNAPTSRYPGETASYAFYVKRNLSVVDEWMTNAGATGQVQVTKIDWNARVISGSFSFTAAARYGSAPITVTDGRFDVKIQ